MSKRSGYSKKSGQSRRSGPGTEGSEIEDDDRESIHSSVSSVTMQNTNDNLSRRHTSFHSTPKDKKDSSLLHTNSMTRGYNPAKHYHKRRTTAGHTTGLTRN